MDSLFPFSFTMSFSASVTGQLLKGGCLTDKAYENVPWPSMSLGCRCIRSSFKAHLVLIEGESCLVLARLSSLWHSDSKLPIHTFNPAELPRSLGSPKFCTHEDSLYVSTRGLAHTLVILFFSSYPMLHCLTLFNIVNHTFKQNINNFKTFLSEHLNAFLRLSICGNP